jgi:Uma2 family endonuclease
MASRGEEIRGGKERPVMVTTPKVPQAEPDLHRFTLEEFMRLGDDFSRGAELLDGFVYDVPGANAPEPKLYRFTVEEYMRLGEDFPRSELLDGLIYDVSPVKRAHAHAVRVLLNTLAAALYGRTPYCVEVGSTLAMQGWQGPWGPEPDLAVLFDKEYTETLTPEDVVAVIEVSDSSDAKDRAVKVPLYVASGIPTWQVNLPTRQVEYYASPESLERPQVFVEGDTFEVLGVPIAVADLLLPKKESPNA